MKKVKKTSGEYIPRNKNSTTYANKEGNKSSGMAKVGDLLGSLNPAQLTQLVSSVSSSASAFLDYSNEREKTKQVKAEVKLGLAEVGVKSKLAKLQYKEQIASFKQIDQQDERRHTEAIDSINLARGQQGNEHGQILKILSLVEKGVIPAEALAQLIHEVRAK